MMVAAKAKRGPNGKRGGNFVEWSLEWVLLTNIKSASGRGLACVDQLMLGNWVV